MTLAIFDITPIPPYNEDFRQAGLPPPVEEFRDKIAAADALLSLSPPNTTIRWPACSRTPLTGASRPPDQPFDGDRGAIAWALVF